MHPSFQLNQDSSGRFVLAVDSSQIASFMECPQRWMLGYRKNLQKKYEKRTAMDRGTVIHGLCERYYRMRASGKDQQACFDHALEEINEVLKQDKPQIHGLTLCKEDYIFCVQRFTQYYLHYKENDFSPLVVEGHPAVEIGFSVPIVDNNLFLLVLEGRIDFIGAQQDLLFVVDHKTQARVYTHYSRTIQFMNYCMALSMQLGINVDRVMINYIGTQVNLKPDEHFRRKLFYYHPKVLSNWKQKLITVMYRMVNSIQNEIYEKNEVSCQGRTGFPCQFTSLCETLSPQQWQIVKSIQYEERRVWQPWNEEE